MIVFPLDFLLSFLLFVVALFNCLVANDCLFLYYFIHLQRLCVNILGPQLDFIVVWKTFISIIRGGPVFSTTSHIQYKTPVNI